MPVNNNVWLDKSVDYLKLTINKYSIYIKIKLYSLLLNHNKSTLLSGYRLLQTITVQSNHMFTKSFTRHHSA